MIIQQQNFNDNFNAAVQYEDISLLFTIFAGEIADLFIQREQDIFELFSQCDIKYNLLSVYEVYVDKILKNVKQRNDDFIVGLSFLISDNNNEIDENWETNLENIATGILVLSEYLNENSCNYLKRQILDAIHIRLKPNNKRKLIFQDDTTFTFLFVIAVSFLFYQVFRKKPIKLIEKKTEVNNPAFNVSPDVLIPESQMPKVEPVAEAPKLETIPEISKPNIEAVKIEAPTETITQKVTPKPV